MRRDKGPHRAADDRELSAGDAAETTALQQHLTNKIASGGKKKKRSVRLINGSVYHQ